MYKHAGKYNVLFTGMNDYLLQTTANLDEYDFSYSGETWPIDLVCAYLKEIKKSVSKDMGEDITVLELSYILNQSINPLMAITYKEKLDKINTFELDPIEVLKKRKNLKILKVLNLMLTLNLDKTIKKDDIES